MSPEHLQMVQTLFIEYWESFGFAPSLQGFSSEVADLPGRYSPPEGRLGLALLEDNPAGCVALRRIDAARCEAKRMYVRPLFRSHGVGRELLNWLIAEARVAGYKEMLGDTMPLMTEALAMYERFGFQRIGPYSENPTPGAIYLRRPL